MERIAEEDRDRVDRLVTGSANRKPNERVVGGNQEVTDEILRQHYLMAKIRNKVDLPTIYRPSDPDNRLPSLTDQNRQS